MRSDTITAFQYFQVVRFLTNILLSILLVKSTLTVEQIGFFEALIVISVICTMFWMTGFTQAFTSRYPSEIPQQQKDLIRICIVILFITGLFIGLLLHFGQVFVTELFPQFAGLSHISLLSLFITLNAPSVMIEQILLVQDRPKELERFAHFSYGVYLAAMAIVLFTIPTLHNLMLVLICWATLKLIYLFRLIQWDFTVKWDKVNLTSFVNFSMPLIVAAFLGTAMDYLDNALVMYYFDASFFPVFRYGARELPFAMLLLSALSNAMIPVLVRQGTSINEIRERTSRLMHWLFPAAIVLMFISPYAFRFVYDARFTESAYIFNVYLLILISRVLLPQTYNFALGQSRIIMWSSVAEILINLVLSLWWVHVWGVYGLAMATVVAYMAQKLFLMGYNYWINGISPDKYIHFKWYVPYSLLLLLSFYLSFNIGMTL